MNAVLWGLIREYIATEIKLDRIRSAHTDPYLMVIIGDFIGDKTYDLEVQSANIETAIREMLP